MRTLTTPLHSLPALHLHQCYENPCTLNASLLLRFVTSHLLSQPSIGAAPLCGGSGSTMTMIDETYEFSAPRFFDFINGQTEEDECRAQQWFDTALSYAPSHIRNVEETFQETIKHPQSMTTEIKEDDAPCSEVKEENNTTTSHVVLVDTERSEDICKERAHA
ncbi:hypothetical protein HN51_027818 [Arachis hypogaea]